MTRMIRLSMLALIVLALLTPPPFCKAGACTYGGKDEAPPFEYAAPVGCTVCSVTVKAGTEGYVFTEDGDDGCYAVSGIGTAFSIMTRIGSPGPACKDISHGKWSIDCDPTALSVSSIGVSPSSGLLLWATAAMGVLTLALIVTTVIKRLLTYRKWVDTVVEGDE